MNDRFFLAAYWFDRRESSRACAERAASCFSRLASVDELFSRWYQLGRSRKDALKREVTLDLLELQKLFERGRNRRDDDRSVIEELGFSLSAWNGAVDDESVGIRLHCGAYGWYTTPFGERPQGNSCHIDLPEAGPSATRILTVTTLSALLAAVVQAWDPDSGVVISYAHHEQVSNPTADEPWVGWLTYLSAERGAVPPLSAPASVIPVKNKGSIIVAVPEVFSAANPAHIKAADAVAESLRKAGLLRPIVSE